MELVYCHKCGFRIAEQDLAQARAVRIDEKVFCPKCAPPPLPALDPVSVQSVSKKKSGSRLISAVDVPKRHPSSTPPAADSRRNVPMPGQKPGNMSVPIAAGAGACALVLGLIIVMSGSDTKKVASSNPNTAPLSVPRSQARPDPTPNPGTTHAPVEYEPPSNQATPLMRAAGNSDPEKSASDALDKVRKFEGLAEGDVAGRIQRLEEFIAKFPDSIAAARANRMVVDLRESQQAPPPTPPTPDTKGPVVAPTPPPPPPFVPTGEAQLSESFDGPACAGLSMGELVDGPAGSNGKVLALASKPGWGKGGLAKWARKPGEARNLSFQIQENTHFRFRYFNVNARDFRLQIQADGDSKYYECELDAGKKNEWISADIPASSLTQIDTSEKMKAGLVFDEVRFKAFGDGLLVVYIDDLWIGAAGTGPANLTPPSTAIHGAAAERSPAQDEFLEAYRAALGKRDKGAAEKLLKAANFPGKVDDLAQDAAALKWLDDLDAAMLKGAEKLKDVDTFELRPEKGNAITIGKRGKFRLDEVKDGIIYAANESARLPIAFDALDAESRDQLALLGMDSDGKGSTLRAFVALLKLSVKSPPYQIAAARGALEKAKAAGAAADVALLRKFLDVFTARLQEFEKQGEASSRLELAAAHDWITLTQLCENNKWEQARAALEAFKEKYGATPVGARKADEIKTLLQKSIEAPLARGLVGYWKFEEGKGNLTADASGNHNNGTVTGAEWTTSRDGTGLSFNGMEDFVDIPDRMRISDALSISIWFKVTGKTRNWGRVISKGWIKGESPWTTYAIMLDDREMGEQRAKFQASLTNDQFSEVFSTTQFKVDQWHHVVGVFDGPKARIAIYVDGVKESEIAAKNKTVVQSPTSVRIGDDPTTKEKQKCVVDEVRIYNRPLSDAEVKSLFNLYK